MAIQAGQDVLLKLEDGVTPGNFVSVAGIRAKTIALNAGLVDATHTGSAGGWRELLSGAGVKSVRVTGSGVFRDEASDTRIREAFMSREAVDWQLIIPDFAQFSGAFLISQLTYGGDFDGEAVFSITLESAGEIGVTEI
ncbi:MAG: phage major tail protein, TP901-1 family [Ponticaulis sp.]|nr:phage major tail protein, TP901-1 family [Ponticaulis sp.]